MCSGANQALYAIFLANSQEKFQYKLSLLRGSDNRMASYFYAMARLLRLKDVLITTVHSHEFSKLDLNARAKLVVRDIQNPKFFQAIFVVCSVVFPNLLLLRWCDKSTPVMDVLYHITLRTSAALEQQREQLLEEDLFNLGADGDVKREGEEVFGPEGEEASAADNATDEMDVHRRFLWAWDNRKTKLQHEYAMAGFALSVTTEVWNHAAQPDMLGTDVRKALEFVVRKLHQDPNPNKATWFMKDDDEIVDTFWSEFADFRSRRKVFGNPARWKGAHVRPGLSHKWHEKYSLAETKVLGFIACRVTSKNAGIGMCERNWGDVKEIKSGKRSGLSGESTEKRALILTTARVKEARLRKEAKPDKSDEHVELDDEDLSFEKDLAKVGVAVQDLKRPVKKRVFQCWMTDEENKWTKKRGDRVCWAKLLRKFGGLNFYDPDTKATYKVHTENMHWEKYHGYTALGVKETDRPKDPAVPFRLDLLCDMIKETDVQQPDNVEIVKNPT